MNKKIRIGIIIIFIFLAIGGLLYYLNNNKTNRLTKVEGYNDTFMCEAMSPGCGLCYGEVIDRQCYVDKSKLTDEELKYMGLSKK